MAMPTANSYTEMLGQARAQHIINARLEKDDYIVDPDFSCLLMRSWRFWLLEYLYSSATIRVLLFECYYSSASIRVLVFEC
jgi:hypothetical protein